MTKTHRPGCPFCFKEQMRYASGQVTRKIGVVSSSGRLKAPKVKAKNLTEEALLLLLKDSIKRHPSRRMLPFY